ncbi:TetR family transcriptional regulator [Bordetella ansorpii]|uniref:TetR family transcriptional regulator n=1 Tax=Bordetella ansorpii TaxID=288768 RepID=A0A157S5T0_9BORD|nr:TetR/AcrR family transcriptional regulator [Bordetella ansorpii]SAI65757.1 TetR family transcriptional regulator [Bordetella ansorpii]
MERRILDAAAGLFASQGYAATSMEQVAEACQAGKDTIYRRYASKGALFTAMMDRFRIQVQDELAACTPDGGEPLQRLQRYARTLLDINLRVQMVALNRVALAEAVPSKGVRLAPSEQDPLMRRMAELVGQAQAAGSLGEGDAFFMAEQLLYATSIRPLVAAMLGDARFSGQAAQQDYFDQAWALFLQGAACKGAGRR